MKYDVKKYWVFAVAVFLFLFFSITGHTLAATGNITWNMSYCMKLLLPCLVLSILYVPLFTFLTAAVRQLSAKLSFPAAREHSVFSCSARRVFFIGWGCFFLAWLPGFLAYMPGICAYDTTIQLGYIARDAISEHHPVIHTMLLKGFTSLGTAFFQSATVGMAIYTILQMLTLSASFAGALGILQHFRCRKLWIILLGIYGMFFPFHMYLAISVTKDTFFTAFMLLQLMCLYGLLTASRRQEKTVLWRFGFLCSSILMMLFRNNGIYAFGVMLGCLLLIIIFSKKGRASYKNIFILSLAAVLSAYLILRLLSSAAGAVQGDRREMLSVPMQQMARTMYYHASEISDTDRDMVYACISAEGLASYRPDIADPVKRHFNTTAILQNPKQFISTYVGLFFQYPGDYVNAFLALNAGYLYPLDTSHAYINTSKEEPGLGYVQTRWLTDELASYDLHSASYLPAFKNILERFASGNSYLHIPVLRYLFMPGIWFWVCLFTAAGLLYKKQYTFLLPFALLGGYYITLLLGPTVQLRYVYPVMCALPFIIAFVCSVSRPHPPMNQ